MLPVKFCRICEGTGLELVCVSISGSARYKLVSCTGCKGTGYRTWIDEIIRPEESGKTNEDTRTMAMD